MADIIHAQQGDTLDALAWREAGLKADALAALLEANPGVAAIGTILPVGTTIILPTIVTRTLPVRDIVQLWS